MQLTYKPTSLEHIYELAKGSGISFSAMESMPFLEEPGPPFCKPILKVLK
jgi:hypothetical protein